MSPSPLSFVALDNESCRCYRLDPFISMQKESGDRQRAFWAFKFGNARHGQAPVRVVTNLVSEHGSWSQGVCKIASGRVLFMDHNESNNQLRATLHDVFGLENSDSLHGNEDSYGGYADGPDRYLDTDDEDVQNLVDEEMNGSHQSVQDKDLSVSDGEEDHYGEDDVEEKEDPKHDDSYTEEQYTAGPVEGMSFSCLQAVFAFYKEHSRLNGFGVVKKSANKLAGQLKELSRTVKRSLVADDIACLRPSKSIRLLEVEVGGPERMRDLKNVLKTHFKTYMVWEDDMVVPNIPDSDFDTDATIVRNSREVRSRGKPQINRNRSSRQYAFHGDARRWGYGYYDVYDKGKNNQGRSGGGRRGCRGSRRGGVCSSRGGRGDDANINNHPIVHEFF
ncbi:hypothetical protein T459_09659 [Capsicum annuum]|uniref:Uncharacterized protein n=1 Tax=Capsicum annuum TaxID=4072 RepID=A0A2G2ZZY2_CAPAN|nr:hypothetical protein T459_09659 [Capsicum annuum]